MTKKGQQVCMCIGPTYLPTYLPTVGAAGMYVHRTYLPIYLPTYLRRAEMSWIMMMMTPPTYIPNLPTYLPTVGAVEIFVEYGDETPGARAAMITKLKVGMYVCR